MLFRRSPLAELEPAQRALAEGRYDAAFALLESAARRPRGRATQALYWLYLAEVYALYGEQGIENGMLSLKSAAASDPGISQHPLYLALFWEFAAIRGEAVGDVKRGLQNVIRGSNQEAPASYHAASALLAAGAFRTASRVLEELDPDQLPAFLRWRRASLLGQAREQLGEWEEAAEAFRQAVADSQGPDQQPERLSLASCLLELGRPEEVQEVLLEVREDALHPDEVAVLRYLAGRAQCELGNPNQGLALLVDAHALEEQEGSVSFSLLYALGQCLSSLGRFPEAVDWYRQAIEAAPLESRPFAQHECAYALMEAEDFQAAQALLEEVLGDPSYGHRGDALADLAEVQFKLGELDQAEVTAQQALELGAVVSSCLTLGHIAYDYYRLEEAIAWFEQAASAATPGDQAWVGAQQMLADVYGQMGPEAASHLYHHASAALQHTDPSSEWYLPLREYLARAEDLLGGFPRVLN